MTTGASRGADVYESITRLSGIPTPPFAAAVEGSHVRQRALVERDRGTPVPRPARGAGELPRRRRGCCRARHRAACSPSTASRGSSTTSATRPRPSERAALLDLVDDDLDRVFAGRTPDLPVTRASPGPSDLRRLPAEPFRRPDRRPTGGPGRHPVRRPSTTCSATAPCPPTPSGASCCTCSAPPPPARIALSDASAPRCRSSSTARTPARTTATAGSTCRPRTCGASAARRTTSPRPSPRPGCAASSRSRPAGRAAARPRARPLIGRLTGFARVAVAGYMAGGRAALAALERGALRRARARPSRPRRDAAAGRVAADRWDEEMRYGRPAAGDGPDAYRHCERGRPQAGAELLLRHPAAARPRSGGR